MPRKSTNDNKPIKPNARRGTKEKVDLQTNQVDSVEPAPSAKNRKIPNSENRVIAPGVSVDGTRELKKQNASTSASSVSPVPPIKKTRGTKTRNSGSTPATNPKRRCIETDVDEQDEKENTTTIAKNVSKYTLYSHSKYWLPRNIQFPIGLTHTPFHVGLPLDTFAEVISRLTILPLNGFPERAKKGVHHLRPGARGLTARSPTATIEAYVGSKPDQEYMDKDDREELMWSAENFEIHLEQEGSMNKKGLFYNDIEKEYLFPIWRQFEGRIPQEVALQKLMTNGYDVAVALDCIDECLKTLPQKLIAPSTAQVQVLEREIVKNRNKIDLGKIQNTIMRNYHISEVFNYYIHFCRFFDFDNDEAESEDHHLNVRIACNCLEPMCRQLNFEPRYACSNCTKTLRTHQLPADQLCLICSAYKTITGETRPAQNVVFDEDDIIKIKLWDTKFKKTDRFDFEKWFQKRKNKDYKSLKLTQEEALMLNFEKLDLNDEHNSLGSQIQSMLQPYILPHFSHCQCQHSGGIPVGSPNFGKTKFSEEEERAFVATIIQTPRNIKAAAAVLNVEEELVEVFLNKYKAGNAVWKDLGRVKVHSYSARQVLPPISPPPLIPRD
ncbi:hypothetical protein CAEBREN_10797 [Caenorhabditis brenneri]|uniref:ELM2 domain-containing protein n=1 Tax=Caenorhabditis brenneri TaxID=135651 RepID=G0MH47_CAEBE|nr:hypothetical protein CAEBREN_10797 [Caenorhabditis brenneri]